MKPPSWTAEIKDLVNARLQEFFADKRDQARDKSPLAEKLIDEIATLTIRGGKRLRAAVLTAGYCAVSDDYRPAIAVDACAAIELMQTYLLVHDDWMDDDEQRRGGPSMHAALRRAHGDAHLGDCLAILAGDLASGYAGELLNSVKFPVGRTGEAFAAYYAMHQDVVFGQQLDLLNHPKVELTYRLKSGSYTVRGPLKLGAILGNGTPAQLAELDGFSEPLGVAFQLRDDLLGMFGESRTLGKKIGNDLRAGKNTLLLAEAKASLSRADTEKIDRVFGNQQAGDSEVEEATQLLATSEARRRVETRLGELLDQARITLRGSSFSLRGLAMLGDLVDLLGIRDR